MANGESQGVKGALFYFFVVVAHLLVRKKSGYPAPALVDTEWYIWGSREAEVNFPQLFKTFIMDFFQSVWLIKGLLANQIFITLTASNLAAIKVSAWDFTRLVCQFTFRKSHHHLAMLNISASVKLCCCLFIAAYKFIPMFSVYIVLTKRLKIGSNNFKFQGWRRKHSRCVIVSSWDYCQLQEW